MIVKEIKEFDNSLLTILQNLVPQLSKNATIPSEKFARRIIESDASRLLVAEQDNLVLGMLTIVIFPIRTGVRAWIEDVFVDEAGRGEGVGETLSMYALKLAKLEGARTVDLTSRPSREAANRLYKRIGFTPRDTNVYRFTAES